VAGGRAGGLAGPVHSAGSWGWIAAADVGRQHVQGALLPGGARLHGARLWDTCTECPLLNRF
jgi:hypothetical protein